MISPRYSKHYNPNPMLRYIYIYTIYIYVQYIYTLSQTIFPLSHPYNQWLLGSHPTPGSSQAYAVSILRQNGMWAVNKISKNYQKMITVHHRAGTKVSCTILQWSRCPNRIARSSHSSLDWWFTLPSFRGTPLQVVLDLLMAFYYKYKYTFILYENDYVT